MFVARFVDEKKNEDSWSVVKTVGKRFSCRYSYINERPSSASRRDPKLNDSKVLSL